MGSVHTRLTTIAAALALAGAANAEDFVFHYYGSTIQAWGTLSGTDAGNNSFDITSGELHVTQGPVAGKYQLLANTPGTAWTYSPSHFFMINNTLNPESTDRVVDWYGLLFGASGVEINIFNEKQSGPGGRYVFYAHGPGGNTVNYGDFTAEPVTTPTPGTGALAGLGGLLFTRRRRA
jgi:MYXO-CTERM domain-containing protein